MIIEGVRYGKTLIAWADFWAALPKGIRIEMYAFSDKGVYYAII